MLIVTASGAGFIPDLGHVNSTAIQTLPPCAAITDNAARGTNIEPVHHAIQHELQVPTGSIGETLAHSPFIRKLQRKEIKLQPMEIKLQRTEMEP